MHSAIYSGQVRHRRHGPTPHEFSYGLFMLYLDLAELPSLFDKFWLWSARRPALARFDRRDYLQSAITAPSPESASEPGKAASSRLNRPELPITSLDAAVRDLVLRETGASPRGPIRLLTHLRYFGYCFNPVSFYYCFDAAGEQVETVVAEITNTPWKQRHAYVLPVQPPARDFVQRQPASDHPDVPGSGDGTACRDARTNGALGEDRPDKVLHFQFDKRFHVSPFMPMELAYDWRMSLPDERLQVHMENWRDGRRVFDATLALHREPISSASLARALLSFPLMTLKVTAAIYWQALKLWLKRVPFFANPGAVDPGSKTLNPKNL